MKLSVFGNLYAHVCARHKRNTMDDRLRLLVSNCWVIPITDWNVYAVVLVWVFYVICFQSRILDTGHLYWKQERPRPIP